jgi:hypothetical protein
MYFLHYERISNEAVSLRTLTRWNSRCQQTENAAHYHGPAGQPPTSPPIQHHGEQRISRQFCGACHCECHK